MLGQKLFFCKFFAWIHEDSSSILFAHLIPCRKMDEANESDAITLFALRQIGCAIPEECKGIGQFNVDILLEVVDKCLVLITSGAIKVFKQ